MNERLSQAPHGGDERVSEYLQYFLYIIGGANCYEPKQYHTLYVWLTQ